MPSDNVIPLRGLAPISYLHGSALCAACGSAWHAVAPVGARLLACPDCGSLQGRLTNDTNDLSAQAVS